MSSKKIVVCDDDEFVYFAVKMIMEKMGYEVFEANFGQKGIDLVNEHIPEVLFQDIEMPKINGFEVCKRVKSESKTSHIPVIFVSGMDYKEALPKILDCDGDYFVAKPFQPDDLAADLYFLAQTSFKPEPGTLSQLRVTQSMEVEKAKIKHKKQQEEIKQSKEEGEESKPSTSEAPSGDGVSQKSFNSLQHLVVVLTKRINILEKLLKSKGILSEEEIQNFLKPPLVEFYKLEVIQASINQRPFNAQVIAC